MPFKLGRNAIIRTQPYLDSGKVYLNEKIKVFTVNFIDGNERHKGLRDFAEWHIPQIKYKNPDVQCVALKNLTPNPFIRVFLESGEEVIIDVDNRERREILNHVIKVLGKPEAVLSAVSPAVLIPSLLAIKEKGYGENKGISTLVIAACSLDDIVAISMFGVILGMIFSDETSSVDFEQKLLQGPLEAGIGFVVGVGWGIVAACFPHCKEKYLVVKRSFMVGGGGLALVLWSTRFGYPGSGPLATIVSSFIAQIYWKKQGWSDEYNPVEVVVNTLWSVMQPLLFGLIGTEIKFEIIQLSLIGQGMAVLAFGSVVRVISCSLALVGSNLNLKETIFVNLAWLPKATVQATLGPLVLDSVIRAGRDDLLSYAQIILTITVLSILVTAPVGAIGISLGGPRLLSHKSVEASRKYSTANDQNTNVT